MAQALAIRLAYSSENVDILLNKLQKFPELFMHYVHANLSTIQSSILQKQAAQKEFN